MQQHQCFNSFKISPSCGEKHDSPYGKTNSNCQNPMICLKNNWSDWSIKVRRRAWMGL